MVRNYIKKKTTPVITAEALREAIQRVQVQKESAKDVCEEMGISERTYFRHAKKLKDAEVPADAENITQKIKQNQSGFRTTGIFPFNRDIFTDIDFMPSYVTNRPNPNHEPSVNPVGDEVAALVLATGARPDQETEPKVAAFEEIETSSASISWSTQCERLRPLPKAGPRVTSNRGRRKRTSTELTCPETREQLRAESLTRENKKKGQATPKTKRGRPAKKAALVQAQEEESTPVDVRNLCVQCLDVLPPNHTRFNTITCNECKRVAHLKCAPMRFSYFNCKNCDSDLDDE